MRYLVESVEDNIARLEAIGKEAVYVSINSLPPNVKEGDMLVYDGKSYVIDSAATEARRRDVYTKFNRLFRK